MTVEVVYNEWVTVSVAEWLRRQVVALEIEGSNPFAHPSGLLWQKGAGCASKFFLRKT